MLMIIKKIIPFILIGLGAWSCSQSSDDYVPKPKGFNRINLPEVSYIQLEDTHPYTFEVSRAAIVQPDTFGKAEPHWIVLYYPEINGRIQLTYKPLGGDLNKLQEHINDAFRLAAKHQVKATSQEEQLIQLKNGKKAVVIQLEGEVPSHYQFYTTDTLNHFLRGAVYLEIATQNDSLRPVIDYLKAESKHLLETLRWK
ncbi:MAG: gliding motility-associated lipoprotein GldD [Spirosomataceae bacterium]|jgi:gliding motility-associated lipoprotein GldD